MNHTKYNTILYEVTNNSNIQIGLFKTLRYFRRNIYIHDTTLIKAVHTEPMTVNDFSI